MKKNNAFLDVSRDMEAGVDALFAEQDANYALIPIDLIQVKKQIRETFEDDENTLADLANSIRERGLLQPILLRELNGDGYELVAGERRLRASKLAGLDVIPAFIRSMSDEEAEDAQLAENIHRLNLTQIEEAKKIQRDLNALGSVDAVLEKHQKSRAWLSKIMGLLDLPTQAKRLVLENVSADIEVINTVKTIEKVDAEKAKELVDDLKKTRGKDNARKKAIAVKKQVKPKKGKSSEGRGAVFAPAKILEEKFSVGGFLEGAFVRISQLNETSNAIIECLDGAQKSEVEKFLHGFYEQGREKKSEGLGQYVLKKLGEGDFSNKGSGAFCLVSFLQGTNLEANWDVRSVFETIEKSIIE